MLFLVLPSTPSRYGPETEVKVRGGVATIRRVSFYFEKYYHVLLASIRGVKEGVKEVIWATSERGCTRDLQAVSNPDERRDCWVGVYAVW